MNVAEVMDELGSALGTIPGLRVLPYWADSITPPSAIVGFPDPLTFDSTYARGMDQQTFPVHVCVGNADARTSRDVVAKYANGSGEYSVKAAIDGHEPTAYDSARVDRAEFGVITVGGTDYLTATFYVDVIGTGE